MELIESQPRTPKFNDDVADIFKLLSLPRMEYNSRGSTGFWDTIESHSFGDILLNQIRKNILYIITEHFYDKDGQMKNMVDNVLKNRMSKDEEISVTFYYKSQYPMAIAVEDTFKHGEKIATIDRRRGANDVAYSESDKDVFDWLYGVYSQGRTSLYGDDFDYAITISIRNKKDFVEYAVLSDDYDYTVKNHTIENKNIIYRLLSYIK